MDKKKNKILMGCLALLLVMTVGYALFSENITINGTATAKGDFSITPTCQPGIPSNLAEGDNTKAIISYYESDIQENGYYNDSCTVSGDTVNFKSDFKWPGARRYFTIKVKNTGSVTAMSREVGDTDVELCNDTNGNDIFDADECSTEKNSITLDNRILHYKVPNIDAIMGIEDKKGNLFLEGRNMNDFLGFDDNGAYLKLEPGESAYLFASLGTSSEVGTDNGGKMNLRASYSTKLIFNQLNKK